MAITRVDNRADLGRLPARAAELAHNDRNAVDAMVRELSDNVRQGDGVALEILGNLALHKDEYTTNRADRALDSLFDRTGEPAVMEVIEKVRQMRAAGWRDGSYGGRSARAESAFTPPARPLDRWPSSRARTESSDARPEYSARRDEFGAEPRPPRPHRAADAQTETTSQGQSIATQTNTEFSDAGPEYSARRDEFGAEPRPPRPHRDADAQTEPAPQGLDVDAQTEPAPQGLDFGTQTEAGNRVIATQTETTPQGQSIATQTKTEGQSIATQTAAAPQGLDVDAQTEPAPQGLDFGTQTEAENRVIATQTETAPQGLDFATQTEAGNRVIATQTKSAPQGLDADAQTEPAPQGLDFATQTEAGNRVIATQTEAAPQGQSIATQTKTEGQSIATQTRTEGQSISTQTEAAPQSLDADTQTAMESQSIATQTEAENRVIATQTEAAPQGQSIATQTKTEGQSMATQTEDSPPTRPLAKKRKGLPEADTESNKGKRPSVGPQEDEKRKQLSVSEASLKSSSARLRTKKQKPPRELEWAHEGMQWDQEEMQHDKTLNDDEVIKAFNEMEKALKTPVKLPYVPLRSADTPLVESPKKYKSSYGGSPLYDAVLSVPDKPLPKARGEINFAKMLNSDYFTPTKTTSPRARYVLWALSQIHLSENGGPLLNRLFVANNKTPALLTRKERQINLAQKSLRKAVDELIEEFPPARPDDHTEGFELLKQLFPLGGYWADDTARKGGLPNHLNKMLRNGNLIFFDYGPRQEGEVKHSPARLLGVRREGDKTKMDFVTPGGNFSTDEEELIGAIGRRQPQDSSQSPAPAFFVLINIDAASPRLPPNQKA